MARKNKKIKLTVTVTSEEREYLGELAEVKEVSVSQLIGAFATAEYKKMQRAKRKEMKKEENLNGGTL